MFLPTWGFMIQFNYTIFFRWFYVQPTTNKKRSMFCCFYCPFFVPQKTEHLERGKFGPPHTSVENFNWTGGTLEKTLGGNPEGGGGGCFEGSFLENLLLVAMECLFVQICPSKLRTHKSWKKLIVLILMKAGFSFTMLIVAPDRKIAVALCFKELSCSSIQTSKR